MFRACLQVAALLGSLWVEVGAQTQTVTVSTEYGPVTGTVIEDVFNGDFSKDVISFYAIPYAEAERFAIPTKVQTAWTEPRYMTWNDSKACPQSGGVFDNTHPGWREFSEDCLFVNVYTPSVSGSLPVMVWFYGGAFTSGGNIMYPGHFLASRDVVVVVVNYRVNDFGFAFSNSAACPGNFGLWDQNFALQFVRDNIANFGGNPGLVTMFGQSAGAASASLQMVSPMSQGLAHQAIMESGTESNFWSVNWPEQRPERYLRELAGNLACSDGLTDEEMITCLRALPWEDIRDARFSCTPGHFCQGMAPVVDGPGGFLPDYPQALRESGNFMQGPIITGITHDDGSMYTVGTIPESVFGGFNRTMFQYYLRNRLLSIWSDQMDSLNDTDTKEDVFQNVDYQYAPWPYVEDRYQNREAFNKMITDAAFGHAWDRQLKDHSRYQDDTYGYIYNYRGRNATDYFAEWMGVPHQGELPQVWGWPLLPWNPQVRADSGIYYDAVNWTDEDRLHTIFWETLYANFATTGNPSPTPISNPTGGDITWSPFSEDDMSYIYVNNVTTEVRQQYRQKEYAFWREHMPYVAEGYPIFYEEETMEALATGLDSDWMEDIEDWYRSYMKEAQN